LAAHSCVAPHAVAHAPQFFSSLVVSTHALEQFTRPVLHEPAHWPTLQTSLPAHAFPQAPQFFGSLRRSTQAPEHATVLFTHATVPLSPPSLFALPSLPVLPSGRPLGE